jgi:hypothetical protein
MTPLVGLFFGRSTLAEVGDLSVGSGLVGRPVWGQSALLANLELRLGLAGIEGTEEVRLQRWSRRLRDIGANSERFYSRSYEADPVGTSRALLTWRDTLVDAGWNGEQIPDGGERLDTLYQLELGAEVPPGRPDRLRTLELAVRAKRIRPLDGIDLADPVDVWPGRWRRLFGTLEELGVRVRTVAPTFAPCGTDTDLGRLQSLLRSNCAGTAEQLTGDGSVILLRAETSWELAHGLAALLRTWDEPSTSIIRGGDIRPLDFALTAHGFSSQGIASVSPWRPVLQVLPLAVELVFEPRDPYRVLELLTLPVGPFSGLVGNRLATALAESPGIGGRAWRFAKESIEKQLVERARRVAVHAGTDEGAAVERASADAKERLARVTEWLEGKGHDPVQGAPRAVLLAVADRVRNWLRNHLVAMRSSVGNEAPDPAFERKLGVIAAALSQAQAFHGALSHEPREVLDSVAARQLVENVSSTGEEIILEVQRVGRIDPVDNPAGLRCSRNTVVWWHCVGGSEWRPSTQPWRRGEMDALRRAGIAVVDPARRLAVEADGWRRAILAARGRLVLAVPRWSEGQQLEPHPVWDEIVARFNAQSVDVARLTLDVQLALEGRAPGPLGTLLNSTIQRVAPLPLPEARTGWRLDASLTQAASEHSASSIEALIGCPLKWVLGYRAGLRSESIVSIPADPVLNGKLGHRLVEELHVAGVFAEPERASRAIAEILDRLILEEAAVLLRPGKAFERAQLRKQLIRSVVTLSELLASSGFVVDAVEATSTVQWGSRSLEGRLDLLLRDKDNRDFVLDLKWVQFPIC